MWDNLFRRHDQEQDILEALRQTYIFQTLSKKELRFVQSTVHVRHFKAGEAVFRQGEIGVGMYILLRGSVDIFVDHPTEDDLPTRQHLVTRLRGGDFLGELSLVENSSRRSATAIAAENSVVIGFFKPDLLEIIDRQPATGVQILLRLSEVLGRRLKETTMKVTELKDEVRRASERV
ncbi:MAG: cyclic nucleotide-binding domain-containing protein [Bdellovibrionales bacterium]